MRLSRLALPALAVVAFLAACGGEGAGNRPGPAPAEPERRQVEPLVLPETAPSAAERIAYYLDTLERGHEDELFWAMDQLVAAGPAAGGPLRDRLLVALERNPLYAVNLLQAVERGASPGPDLEGLVRATGHDDYYLRTLGAHCLGRSGSEKAVPALLDLLDDSLQPAEAAVAALRRIGGEGAARGLLGRFPDHVHPDVRDDAVLALTRMLPREKALPVLVGLLEDDSLPIVVAAARGIFDLDDDDAVTKARAALRPHLEGEAREFILNLLAASADPELLPGLLRDARRPEPAIVSAAAARLTAYRTPDAEAAIWDAARGGCFEAYLALIARKDPDVAPYAASLLGSEDPADRLLAAKVLGQVDGGPVLDRLLEAAAREPDTGIRNLVVSALALTRRPAAATAIVEVLASERSEEPSTAFAAYNAGRVLGLVPEIPEEARAGLRGAFASENPAIRMHAALAAGRPGLGPETTAAFVPLLTDGSIHVRRAAVPAFVEMDGATTGPLERAYVQETDPLLRRRIEVAARQVLHRWPE